jgi:glycerophosphoryl diester phosphodiesterase
MKIILKVLNGIKITLLTIIVIAVGIIFTAATSRGAGLASYAPLENRYISDTPLVTAHRVGSSLAPENTLLAIEMCLSDSTFDTDVWEFDLHITKDNKLVLLHDNMLNRTSNATSLWGNEQALAIDYTLAELKQLNMGYNFSQDGLDYPYRSADEEVLQKLQIVTVEEAFDYLESTGENYEYIIEIKNEAQAGLNAMELLYAILIDYNLTDRVIVGSFNDEVGEYIDNFCPLVTRSATTSEVIKFFFAYRFNLDLSKRVERGEFGYSVLQIPLNYKFYRMDTKEFVDYAHNYGFAVQYWTINNVDDMLHLINIGADAIMSDSPNLAYATVYLQ